jgi:alkylhydroperoxidase family enzyme
MKDVVYLVPGFEAALERLPGTLGAYNDLQRQLERGTLSSRSRSEIGLIVANRIGCDYCRWAMERVAEHRGMRQEDIFFASLGISRGRREAAIARLAKRMVECTDAAGNVNCDPQDARMFGQAELAEIVAQVALVVLTCTVLQSVAPNAVPARKEA